MRSLFAVVLLLAGLAYAQDIDINKRGETPVEAKFVRGGHIRMDLCSSGVEVTGTDEAVVRVSYHPERYDTRVRLRVTGHDADLRMTGCANNNFQVKIEIPKSSDLFVRMFAGQLDVRDVTGDKDIALSFGQLNVDVGKTEQYERVSASVNSGELNAAAFNVEKGGLFRSFSQSGPGKYRMRAHVGAGEIDLR